MEFPWSYWLGAALLIWWAVDLISGEVYLWQPYRRSEQAGVYWLTMAIWGLVALSCFIYPHWQF
ncbi:hypothetical protein [Thalassotalea euphylliae]|uniref:hypothetical protein n=1 Tax=Thalassotalea euphylliae TaxID=1655234 RepID=UPI0036DE75A9